MGFSAATMATIKAISLIVGTAATGYGLYQQKRASDKAEAAQAEQKAAVASLVPPEIPTGPTAAELEAQRQAEEAKVAKEAADKRASDLEASIKADTETALKQKSIIGLASTVKTSASGLLGRAITEKKSLLGQGGAY